MRQSHRDGLTTGARNNNDETQPNSIYRKRLGNSPLADYHYSFGYDRSRLADKADHWLSILMTKHPYMYDNVSTVDIRKTENAQYQEAEPEPEPEIAS